MIKTDRLTIRPVVPEDKEDLLSYLSNPNVAQYLPDGIYDEAKVDAWLEEQLETSPVAYSLIENKSGTAIGHIHFHPTLNDYTYEIGWVIHPDSQKKGYAFEAAKALMEHGFAKMNIQRIVATCQPENTASYQLMEKLGMRREGHFKQCIQRSNGEWWDEYFYAILKTEM
ncbi:GNAT family N-acetyltransferase [Vibrio nigripulchritudo]|uniref:GNAT family N-acetyltransferase n=1 Tax=Vibrio nigripulchritudo TaxID=28173 RepID=UPI001EF405A5|nr:GNAT family protein [Vibrio nigripulchritudo]